MKYVRYGINHLRFSLYGIAMVDGDNVTPLPVSFKTAGAADAEVEELTKKLNEPAVTIIDDGTTIEA